MINESSAIFSHNAILIQ